MASKVNIHIAGLREIISNIDFLRRIQPNLISIRDNRESPAYDMIDNAGLKNLLVVNFDDITEPIPGRYEKVPEENDIKIILEWAKQKMQENNNEFIVQCTAGISRSSAVAILVNYLQDPENALKVINPMLHCPNPKVLELGDKILNSNIKEPVKKIMDDTKEQFLANMDKGGSVF